MAAWFLSEHGLVPLSRNVSVGRGEIDLLARDGGQTVAVEVRTTVGRADPIDALPMSKRRHVADLGRRIGVRRVDAIGIGLDQRGMTVHWVPGES